MAEFNRPHLPPLPDTKHEDGDMKGGKANEEPAPSSGKSNICIAWEILSRLFGAALMDCSFWNIDDGIILYDRQYPESDTLSLDRKIFWSWIGIWGAVVVSGMVWTEYIKNSGK